MITLSLSKAAQLVQGKLIGKKARFQGLTQDSRQLTPGNLFVAITGPNFDGHDYIAAAREHGAAGALVERTVESDCPQLCVKDARIALGQLAQYWREQFKTPIIAVTGSNGKTTVKNMLTSICAHASGGKREAVLAPIKTYNNDIGVPLTLSKFHKSHRYAVIEMGMNHPGEIAYLTQLTQPNVAVITNAGPCHLEGLGSIDAVARAKAEIFLGLSAGGIAVINVDDKYGEYWQAQMGKRGCLTFGIKNAADVSAPIDHLQFAPDGSHFVLLYDSQSVEVHLPVPGYHNVMNALAASAGAIALNISLAHIKKGLEEALPEPGRLTYKKGIGNALIIDDTYNANPLSSGAALDVLSLQSGRKVLVLGDMVELGQDKETFHHDVGIKARESNIDALYTFGELSQYAAKGFGDSSQHFTSQQALINALRNELNENTVVLVKGSRSMHMETIVEELIND